MLIYRNEQTYFDFVIAPDVAPSLLQSESVGFEG